MNKRSFFKSVSVLAISAFVSIVQKRFYPYIMVITITDPSGKGTDICWIPFEDAQFEERDLRLLKDCVKIERGNGFEVEVKKLPISKREEVRKKCQRKSDLAYSNRIPGEIGYSRFTKI